MLLGAAAAWAVTIVFVRSHRFTTSALSLAPWQMLVAAVLLLPVAMTVEGWPASIGSCDTEVLMMKTAVRVQIAHWTIARNIPATFAVCIDDTAGLVRRSRGRERPSA